MNGKSLMLLAMAVAFGLGAMLLTRQMLAQDPGKHEEETQETVVAARDIKEEESLKPEMVKLTRMAKSAIPAGAFTSPKDVETRWVKTVLLEGDVIIEKKLGLKGTPPGLVANIPQGMRAFTIDVNEQSGVSGFILPGSRIDVVRYEANEKGVQHGETILQDVLVLAAGQVFTRAEERSLTTRTVTFAVTPDQVQLLVAARAKGSLSLSLRGVNDHTVVNSPKPKYQVDETLEKRWKLEEEKRKNLEKELQELKLALAKKAAEPPPPAPLPPPPPAAPPQKPRIVTVYRGIDQVQRVRLDGAALTELATRPEVVPKPEAPDRRDRFGLHASQGAPVGDEPGS